MWGNHKPYNHMINKEYFESNYKSYQRLKNSQNKVYFI